MKEKQTYRLKNGAVALFLMAAGVADLTTLIPFVGDFVGPIFWTLAAVYLWRKGLGLVNAKRLGAELISFVCELIPGVQEFPTIFIASVAIVAMSRIEDKTGFKIPLKGKGVKGRVPVNHDGVRAPQKQIDTDETLAA
ncbi:MAG TPA: hypothetical protein VL335_00320 [Candidatus Paceibacterota bacterium]|jgi:hypothetical protein|nr:hypothetical protein [Candidatus Paceibacterota bacterium]